MYVFAHKHSAIQNASCMLHMCPGSKVLSTENEFHITVQENLTTQDRQSAGGYTPVAELKFQGPL
jgi:hypothetical protein